MKIYFLFFIVICLVAPSLYARRPPPSPIVISHINNRHIDIIVIAKVIDVGYRVVERTEAEILAAKNQWDRMYGEKDVSEVMSPKVLPEQMRDRLRREYLSQTVYVMRLNVRIENSLKGRLIAGEEIHVEWLAPIQNPQRAKADVAELIKSFPENSLNVLSLRNPSAGFQFYPEPDWSIQFGDRIGLDEAAAESQKLQYQNLIGQYIANMDFLTEHYDNLTPRGRRNLTELWGPLDDMDKETLIAEWRKERARFKGWKEYELTDAVKKRLIVDKPADEEMRD